MPPLLNIPNPAVFWPKRDGTPTAFRPLAQASSPIAAPSSGESSQNSSPLDFSNWRLGSDYHPVHRLFGDSVNGRFPPALTQMGVREDNRSALMAVAAAISAAATAAASAANNDRNLTVPAPAQSPDRPTRRGPRISRQPRTSTSSAGYRKSASPSNTGANWKSRQPTECDYCKRMFSNKFNLKQVSE